MPKRIVDLHIHSHYSRATSSKLSIEGIVGEAKRKGIHVIATGDITHPAWLAEIAEKTTEDGSGFLRLAGETQDVQLALFGEIASIYKKDGATRRIHTLFGVSSLRAAKKANEILQQHGCNVSSDGRPIIGMDVVDFARIVLDVDPTAIIIPAHIWTPWFSMFGSKSGFDSLAACWGEVTPHIYAIETGLSSDPAMNWRVADLNGVTILSNSDAHSPQKIGREANVFEWPETTWEMLHSSLQHQKNLIETIEFFPEEGKYHLDGHRTCNLRLTPKETRGHDGRCPSCHLPLVIGVMHRVEDLATQDATARPHHVPFRSIIPLVEILGEVFGVAATSKKVHTEYERLLDTLGSEFFILLDAPLDEIRRAAHPMIAEGITRVREGKLHITPGYDGVFGTIHIFSNEERQAMQPTQQNLFS